MLSLDSMYQEMINNGTMFIGTPFEYLDENGVKYYEFHVDDNEEFSDWTDWPDEESRKFGGCLSVRKPSNSKPLIIFGQDECIYKQYIFCKKSWMGPEGQTALVPKDEGQGVMLSSFVSRDYRFSLDLTKEQLKVRMFKLLS